MATRVITETVDDLDGSVLADGEAHTVPFSIDGVRYEIDLGSDNREKLVTALEPWIARARRISGPKREKPKPRSSEQTQAIREWAKASGYTISDRGRIPAQIEEKFHEVGGVPLTGKDRPKKQRR